MASIAFITAGGVCERFPDAKFIFLEANGGWLVPWLERLDHHCRKYQWEVEDLSMLPSEYFRRQCWISFDPDEAMLAMTAQSPLVGADRIIWASDYPHPDAKFPGVTEELTEALEDLDLEQKRQITSESALALYGIDSTHSRTYIRALGRVRVVTSCDDLVHPVHAHNDAANVHGFTPERSVWVPERRSGARCASSGFSSGHAAPEWAR